MKIIERKITAGEHFDEIFTNVSWAKISREHFGKSSSWIYNKLKGIDGNGGKDDFTLEEKEILRGALFEIADTIRKTTEKFY